MVEAAASEIATLRNEVAELRNEIDTLQANENFDGKITRLPSRQGNDAA